MGLNSSWAVTRRTSVKRPAQTGKQKRRNQTSARSAKWQKITAFFCRANTTSVVWNAPKWTRSRTVLCVAWLWTTSSKSLQHFSQRPTSPVSKILGPLPLRAQNNEAFEQQKNMTANECELKPVDIEVLIKVQRQWADETWKCAINQEIQDWNWEGRLKRIMAEKFCDFSGQKPSLQRISHELFLQLFSFSSFIIFIGNKIIKR